MSCDRRVALLAASLALVPGTSRAQSLVDFLRGLGAASAPAYAASSRGDYEGRDAPYPDDEGRAPARPAFAAGPRADPLMTLDLLHDTTLRPGDAVMTARGPAVFVGDPDADPHSPSDFVVPTPRGPLDAGDRRRLAAVAPDPDRPPSTRGAVVGRSVRVDGEAVVGREVVDARGKRVRYVGP